MYGDNANNQSDALSVSAAMALAKGALESVTVRLIGEVSEVSNKAGYKAVYFTVKDESASLPCMMWKNRFDAAGIPLRLGMLVELSGRFSLYAAKGRMNFDVFSLSLAGEGKLRLLVANLAKALQAEGLMDGSRKKPLPAYPETIGVVTSPRGAAVHDVLRTLRRRYPLARVLLAGVPVEGATAPAGLIAGLQRVADAGAEVVLLVRGGGSFEDLMPFNDEALARSIAAMPIPVVTGIGHEPDTCIADMVSDVRASTPTAAAEAVSPSSADLLAAFRQRAMGLRTNMQRRMDAENVHIERVRNKPAFSDSQLLFADDAMALDMHQMRLAHALPGIVEGRTQRLQQARIRLDNAMDSEMRTCGQGVSLRAARLHDLSPLSVLSRGYAITRDDAGAIVTSAAEVQVGSPLSVRYVDGTVSCVVQSRSIDGVNANGAEKVSSQAVPHSATESRKTVSEGECACVSHDEGWKETLW